jgi:hypothetical protein
VESLPLSVILPDRFQPRPLLPSWIRARYFSGELSCYDAAREWMAAGNEDAGIQARVETLVRMGDTFEEYGQIKPITGTWQEINRQRVFVIETGERRFWAACLHAVQHGYEEEPAIQALPVQEPARERQVIENQHAEAPTAVARAREIASLLLDAVEIYPMADLTDDSDYFRQALGRRHKMETWERIETIMGVSRPYMTRLLKVLSLPTHLLELADHYNVPERVLREVLGLSEEQQEPALLQAIEQGLSHEEIQYLNQDLPLRKPEGRKEQGPRRTADPAQKAARKLKSVFRAIERDFPYEDPVGALASYLATELRDPDMIRWAADALEDLAQQLRVRS